MGSIADCIRVLHFLNPFFAGLGGEEANDRGPEVEAGARGPGRRIDELFGGWQKAQKTHFADGGIFDQLYRPGQ